MIFYLFPLLIPLYGIAQQPDTLERTNHSNSISDTIPKIPVQVSNITMVTGKVSDADYGQPLPSIIIVTTS